MPRPPKKLVELRELIRFPNRCFLNYTPTKKQDLFLSLRNHREVFYGGAAGGGKSMALLMAALEYVRWPGYAALLIRKDFSRLGLAGGLMQRAHELFSGREDVQWVGSRRSWVFWTGDEEVPSSITFGYLSRPLDKFRYASSEFQYIAFDELTDFSEEDYLFLFSRLRRSSELKDVPLRMRSASNPGGRGHGWVKERFIPEGTGDREQGTEDGEQAVSCHLSPDSSLLFPAGVLEKHRRLYVPSRIADNPHLDGEEYRQSLLHLPPVERERLLNGDWSVHEKGHFREEWLRYYVVCGDQVELLGPGGRILATIPESRLWRFVTIDPAGTSEERTAEVRGRTPSWSVVQVWDQPPEISKFLLLRHQERKRVEFAALCELARRVWREWRPVKVYIEGERLGQALLSTLKDEMPLECLQIGKQGKVERAVPLIMKMERGEIFLPKHEASWRPKFEGELLAWTGDKAEPADQIDAAAYAARVAEERRGGVVRVV